MVPHHHPRQKAMTDDDIIAAVIKAESSEYTDSPGDRGGPTKYGITLATLTALRGPATTAADVEALTAADATAIYHHTYIQSPHFDAITSMSLRALVVDWGVTSGPHAPSIALQSAVGVKQDGVLGPVTLAAINGGSGATIFSSVLYQRETFYHAIASADPSQQKFLAGWLNRCEAFTYA